MNIEYKEKYLKYKAKYVQLKKNHEGGMIPFNDGERARLEADEIQREADTRYGAAAPRRGAYEAEELQRQREALEAYSRAKQREDAKNARARQRKADARYGAAAPMSGVDKIQRQRLLMQQEREEMERFNKQFEESKRKNDELIRQSERARNERLREQWDEENEERARKQEAFMGKMRDRQEARIRKMRDDGHISKSADERLLKRIASRRKMRDGTGANPFNFESRLKSARIMVIGAGYLGTDLERWSQIDPNYVGVSHMHDYDENPIPDLDSWNIDGYWERLFKIINRKFEAIYIDVGTLHHMIENRKPIEETSFGRFIKYIHENQITNLLYIESRTFDVSTVQEKWDDLMITNRYPGGNRAFPDDLSYEEKVKQIKKGFQKDLKKFEKKINYRDQFFKCCGESQYVPLHDGSNGIWKSYQRRQ